MAFVLDSSVALAWILPDEETSHVDTIAARLESEPALVPVIWPFEVHNALLVALRRDRLTRTQLETCVNALTALTIEVDPDSSLRNADRALTVAEELELSVYDASYLELAIRHGVALASIDERLRTACAARGVPLL